MTELPSAIRYQGCSTHHDCWTYIAGWMGRWVSGSVGFCALITPLPVQASLAHDGAVHVPLSTARSALLDNLVTDCTARRTPRLMS